MPELKAPQLDPNIKAQYTISHADAFVTAVAQREHAVVLTGDPEFESVEALVKIDRIGEY